MLLLGRTKEEILKALDSLIFLLQNLGFVINQEKSQLRPVQEIEFWGLQIRAERVQPDPAKVEALNHFSAPSTKEDLVSFLCMMQSNSDFIPNFATISSNLRDLTTKNTRFNWKDEHQKTFEKLVNEFKKETMLQYFDMGKQTFLLVDAHQTGLGAMLAQGAELDLAKPVAIASRTTNNAEKRYPQIDHEA